MKATIYHKLTYLAAAFALSTAAFFACQNPSGSDPSPDSVTPKPAPAATTEPALTPGGDPGGNEPPPPSPTPPAITTPASLSFEFHSESNSLLSSGGLLTAVWEGEGPRFTEMPDGRQAVYLNENNHLKLAAAEEAETFEYSGDFLLAFWLKMESGNSGQSLIFTNKDPESDTSGLSIYYDEENSSINVDAGDEENCQTITLLPTEQDGGTDWVHIALLHNENGGLTAFVNGTKKSIYEAAYFEDCADAYIARQDTTGACEGGFFMEDFKLLPCSSQDPSSEEAVQNLAARAWSYSPKFGLLTRTGEAEAFVPFTASLANENAEKRAYKVYKEKESAKPLTSIKLFPTNGGILLSAPSGKLSEGVYYISATETGKLESERAAIEVPCPLLKTPTPVFASYSAARPTAGEAAYTITGPDSLDTSSLTCRVYTDASCTTSAYGVIAVIRDSVLSLSGASPGVYYVSVTQSGFSQSSAVALNVFAAKTQFYMKFDSSLKNEFPNQGSPLVRTPAGTVTEAAFKDGLFSARALHLSPGEYLDLGDGAYYGAGEDFTVSYFAKINSAETLGSGNFPLVFASTADNSGRVFEQSYRASGANFVFGALSTGLSSIKDTAAENDKWVCVVLYFSGNAADKKVSVYTGAYGDEPISARLLSNDACRVLDITQSFDGGNIYIGNQKTASSTASSMAQDGKTKGLDWCIQNLMIVKGRVDFEAIYNGEADPLVSSTPLTANTTVKKSALNDERVEIPLLNTPPFLAGTTASVSNLENFSINTQNVSASITGSSLLLTKTGGVPNDTYYVSVTEPGKSEGKRLRIKVVTQTQRPLFKTVYVPKPAPRASSVTGFLVSNSTDYGIGTQWKVYDSRESAEQSLQVTVFVFDNVLTLRGLDVKAGTYWVSANNLILCEESERFPITVGEYGEGFVLPFRENTQNSVPGGAEVSLAGENAAALSTLTAGRDGSPGALNINYDRYLDLGSSFDYTKSFSAAFWIKVNAASSNSGSNSDPVILTNGVWDGDSQEWVIFVRRTPKQAGGVPGILLHSKTADEGRLGGGEDLYIYKNGETSVTDSGWVHIAVVYDKEAGERGQVRFYANGEPSAARPLYTPPLNTDLSGGIASGEKTLLGNANDGAYNKASRYVEFDIQDFYLVNTALEDEQVAALAACAE